MSDAQVISVSGAKMEGAVETLEAQTAGAAGEGEGEGAPRFATLDDFVKQRRQQYRAAKKADKDTKKNKKIVVNVKSSGAVQDTVRADNVVDVFNLPPHITEEKMRLIVKDAVSIQPTFITLGKPIKVGFKSEGKATEFVKYMTGLYCEETGKKVIAKMKSTSVTLVRRV